MDGENTVRPSQKRRTHDPSGGDTREEGGSIQTNVSPSGGVTLKEAIALCDADAPRDPDPANIGYTHPVFNRVALGIGSPTPLEEKGEEEQTAYRLFSDWSRLELYALDKTSHYAYEVAELRHLRKQGHSTS